MAQWQRRRSDCSQSGGFIVVVVVGNLSYERNYGKLFWSPFWACDQMTMTKFEQMTVIARAVTVTNSSLEEKWRATYCHIPKFPKRASPSQMYGGQPDIWYVGSQMYGGSAIDRGCIMYIWGRITCMLM